MISKIHLLNKTISSPGNPTIPMFELRGLSTDTKPTTSIPNGTSFLEIDTGEIYYFDGEQWILPTPEEEA